MKRKPFMSADVLLPLFVTSLGCALYFLQFKGGALEFLQRLEWITYDWRVRGALLYDPPVPQNLGAVYIDDDSLRLLNEEQNFIWPWPRHVFGQAVRELKEQGAKAIAFDILFSELQPTRLGGTPTDEIFAREMHQAGNVVLAVLGDLGPDRQWAALPPHPLFQTNAHLGHIVIAFDPDGVVRETFPFLDDPGLGRIWQLGFVLAAMELGIDLSQAVTNPKEILLMKDGAIIRRIPLHRNGKFPVEWSVSWNDRKLTRESIENVLIDADNRKDGLLQPDNARAVNWTGKLVVVGSIASGNNVSDMGSTPVSRADYLVTTHLNIVASILTGRYVRYSGTALSLLLIILLGAFATLASRQPRVVTASLAVGLMGTAYLYCAVKVYIYSRYCLPLVIPLGTLSLGYLSTVSYRVILEQKERLRVRHIFSKIVSPEVVTELLQAENLKLGGNLLPITVYFADVRDFTLMTDRLQSAAKTQTLQEIESEAERKLAASKRAQEALKTINLYLGTIADIIKKYHGTLDKYIGDCVMAFWGAPTHNDNHAVDCVRAAMESQRAVDRLNKERAAENQRRTRENESRREQQLPPLELLPVLSLGSGINTGEAIVGLMGSDDHILSYTVFGREVNIASRLEAVSGRGRIIISEATYRELAQRAPDLAARCLRLPKVTVKGIREEIQIYQVPWETETTIVEAAAIH